VKGRSAKLLGVVALGFVISCVVTTAAAESEVSDRERLIFEATRWATTPVKRERKRAARETLFEWRAEGLREVMKRVGSQNIMVRVLAQEIVERLPAEEAVPVLLDFLDASDPETRRIAVFFLGFYQAPEHAERVRALLQDDDAAGAAIRTLGKWKVREAVSEIAPFLKHDKETRRIAAINALRDIGDPQALPLLEPCLQDRYFTVRRAAARAAAILRASAPQRP
jgi:hypothetical protein